MISAFGVEHGFVSKGLPRYLKDVAPVIGASPTRTFRGGEPLSRSDYTYTRVRANQHGKAASQAHSKWKKSLPEGFGDFTQSEKLRKPVVEAGAKGKLARAGSRKAIADNTPIVRPKKPRRPNA